MKYSEQQKLAVRHAFYLADYDGELRTLPGQPDGVIVFVVDQEHFTGDARSLEIVLGALLSRRVMVTGGLGSTSEALDEVAPV